MTNPIILEAQNVVKKYPIYGGILRRVVANVNAVTGVSFTLRAGETLGLVGESGCGKSTLARTLIRLEEINSGKILFEGKDIASMKKTELRKARSNFQMIFQDPFSSLNPKMSVQRLLEEPIYNFYPTRSKNEVRARVNEILNDIGFRPEYAMRYSHEFSGGQRQRISIGRALAAKPRLIVCDEPVSALDVSIQAQILNLLMNLQEKYAFSYIFISHDLHVVRHISQRIAVMYLGKIVEIGNNNDIFKNSLHPYTRALMSAVPSARLSERKERIILKGDVPSPISPPAGCAFHPRCPHAKDICKEQAPELYDFGNGHFSRCLRVKDLYAH